MSSFYGNASVNEGGDSDVQVDPGLTIEGAAADAKATGQALVSKQNKLIFESQTLIIQ